jgi:hypothetical protein
MNPHYPQIALRALHRCEYCRAPEAMFNFPFEVEHIVPTSEGGEEDDGNFALACRSCNLFKGVFIRALDPQTKNIMDLFHPRQDSWHQHFVADSESGVILGLTPTGRATVERLNMNSSAQILARRQWMRLGLFP